MFRQSLTEAILGNKDKIRFHTPSHAGILSSDFLSTDVTELPYTDNLMSPGEYITSIEKKAASAYKAEACFISTQGATHNIFQAVFATVNRGAYLIVGNAHSSVYNAVGANGGKAYHVDFLDKNTIIPSDVKTAVLTSPDYFGNVLPLEEIVERLKKEGIITIIDSAHGSHFAFSDKLPNSATLYGDLVILSLHKTLPVATGGSVLCCKAEYAQRAFLARKIYHTTSPSFVTICSIERAIDDYSKNGKRYYDEAIREIEKFALKVKPPFFVKETADKTRLVLTSPYDGEDVNEILFTKGFVAETTYGNDVVFIVNPNNYNHLAELADAVNGIGDRSEYIWRDFPKKAHPNPTPIEFGCDAEEVPLRLAEGRKIYLGAGLYPPGVPLLYPGDEITEEAIAYLSDEKNVNSAFGVEKGKVFVIK